VESAKAIHEQQITLGTLEAENAAVNARLGGLEKTHRRTSAWLSNATHHKRLCALA